MSESYSPPFKITSAIVSLVADISQLLGRLSAPDSSAGDLRLRRANRIRTIQGSIEGNTLSEDQVTAILRGQAGHCAVARDTGSAQCYQGLRPLRHLVSRLA